MKIAIMNNQIDKIPTKDDFYFWKKQGHSFGKRSGNFI